MPELGNRDELWGRLLNLAQKGWGQTHPNPMVGALIVEDGEVVAEGHAVVGGANGTDGGFFAAEQPTGELVPVRHVIDFISVHWDNAYFPAFNIADSAITVGAAMMIIDVFLEGRRAKKTESAAD